MDSKKAIFLDRDGVINKGPRKHDYVKSWKEFKFNPKIFELLRVASKKRYKVIVVTNQRGIARHLYTHEDFLEISKNMLGVLRRKKLYINAVYYCPHEISENCSCRKSNPGMFLAAIKDFKVDPTKSIMLGDSRDDGVGARMAGIRKVVIVQKNLKKLGIVDKIFNS